MSSANSLDGLRPTSSHRPAHPNSVIDQRLQQLLPQLFNPQIAEGTAYLRLQLTPSMTIAVPLSAVEETQLLMREQITPMPNMPDHVLGLMGTKGQVFWVIDLAQRLGLPPVSQLSQRYEVAIVRFDDRQAAGHEDEQPLLLGLIVNQIKGAIRVTTIDAPQNCPTAIAPFIHGSISQGEETLLCLDLPQLL